MEALILAGGSGKRAGGNKLLFEITGKPLILHTIHNVKPFVKRIVVVTGRYHDDLFAALKHEPLVDVVFNKDHYKGMFSSVQCGMRLIKDDVLIMPGDMPFIKQSTFKQLSKNSGQLRVPIYNNQKGHPLFIHHSLIKPLLEEPKDSHLKRFRDRYTIYTVPVEDPGILIDIDTLEDFKTHVNERG